MSGRRRDDLALVAFLGIVALGLGAAAVVLVTNGSVS